MKVASIGECMIEFSQTPDGAFRRGFGGDTLNTALYLSRLGVETSYVTALGDDALSEAMLATWRSEGIRTDLVLRIAGRLPGLYMIERDARGERTFLYWRDRAPARELFERADASLLDRLAQFDWLYLSGISLSLYGDNGRARLRELLASTRQNGGKVAFDGNYRPRGWPDRIAARRAFEEILPLVDLAMPTFEDEQVLFDDDDVRSCLARLSAAGVGEIVVKRGALGCVVRAGGEEIDVPPPRVVQPVDTTAAGDSFNAAYLAARIRGAAPREAAFAGHRLAGAVILSPGAVIERDQMPKDIFNSGEAA
ncbi:MAG TPA: sugar kinase [Bradyrhizobium sp.]|uniref:sugar kinase n=1 Tax=Bradyrhizobium sp. TaxID=376 RepID=UPI002D7E61CE|nr:sugar kinase [Bradyrhizobium sp.]HET7888870.1 sugar kinase [Bradyrhizobium sp.]